MRTAEKRCGIARTTPQMAARKNLVNIYVTITIVEDTTGTGKLRAAVITSR